MDRRNRKKQRKAKRDEKRRRQPASFDTELVARKFLKRVGLWTDIRRLGIEDKLKIERPPRFLVRESSSMGGDMTRRIAKEIDHELDRSRVMLPSYEGSFSVRDFLTVVRPLAARLQRAKSADPDIRAFCAKARHLTRPFADAELVEECNRELVMMACETALKYSRINGTLYCVRSAEQSSRNGRRFGFIEVRAELPRVVQVRVDGASRPAYQCGIPLPTGDVKWVTWPGSVINIPDDSREFPVYVQQHAFDRLCGPTGRIPVADEQEFVVHFALWASLVRPTLIPTESFQNGEFLVEFRMNDVRLGYLVAVLLKDKILIRTFKFITMDGTPEGRELWKKLRLRRADKEHLKLDELMTFVGTDLREDQTLVSLLQDCKCGHLFDVGEFHGKRKSGVSSSMRQYLRLDKPK